MGDIKIFDIQQLVEKANIKAFVETGTLYGDTIEFMRQFPFEEIHSIEIDAELAENARKRFDTDKRVQIHNGHSASVLKTLLPTIKLNTLFWLDAHFPGADAHKTQYGSVKDENINLPLKNELDLISKRKFKDLLIIDDLWIYEDGNFEWGTFDKHMESIGSDVKRADICSTNSEFIYTLFENTHNFKKYNNHQGYLVLMPK